nr:MAG TPA: hypothetical protein [Caudoviricetes sp.]
MALRYTEFHRNLLPFGIVVTPSASRQLGTGFSCSMLFRVPR